MKTIQTEEQAMAEIRAVLFITLIDTLNEMPTAERRGLLIQALQEHKIPSKIFFKIVHNLGFGLEPKHKARLSKFFDMIMELRELDILAGDDRDIESTRIFQFRKIFIDEGRMASLKEVLDKHKER